MKTSKTFTSKSKLVYCQFKEDESSSHHFLPGVLHHCLFSQSPSFYVYSKEKRLLLLLQAININIPQDILQSETWYKCCKLKKIITVQGII